MGRKTLKDKTIVNAIEKWSKVGLLEGLDENIINQPQVDNTSFDSIQFPIVKRVASATLAEGGWTKSKKQQLKEDRINKIRKLEGKKPNVELENDEFVHGLVSVQPISLPNVNLFYMDFKYEPNIREKRRKKLKIIDRMQKLNYIKELFIKYKND